MSERFFSRRRVQVHCRSRLATAFRWNTSIFLRTKFPVSPTIAPSDYSHNFAGPIPESIGQLQKMKYLYAKENELSGSLPESLGNITCLQVLNVKSNNISGSIPASFGQLKSLKYFDAKNNKISGWFFARCSHTPCLIDIPFRSVTKLCRNNSGIYCITRQHRLLCGREEQAFGHEFPADFRDRGCLTRPAIQEENGGIKSSTKLCDLWCCWWLGHAWAGWVGHGWAGWVTAGPSHHTRPAVTTPFHGRRS